MSIGARFITFWWNMCFTGMRPKKDLVETAKIIDSNQMHMNKDIMNSERISIKWSELIHFKQTFSDPFPKHREDGYIKAGIVPFHGHAKFIAPTSVKVRKDNNDNNSNNYNGNEEDNIILNSY